MEQNLKEIIEEQQAIIKELVGIVTKGSFKIEETKEPPKEENKESSQEEIDELCSRLLGINYTKPSSNDQDPEIKKLVDEMMRNIY